MKIKIDHDAFFSRMQIFEGGDDIFFIKFLLLLESVCIKHPWIFTYLQSTTMSDPTAPMTILESDPHYFNLNRIHTDQTEKALEAMKLFRSLLGSEPLSIVEETISNTNLSPRKRITRSIEILIRSYTNNSVETGGLLDTLLANLPPITQFSEIGRLTEQMLSIKKHLDRLDIFFVSKTGGSSCKLSDSTAVTTLLQKLEGSFFFTARERIQGKLTESTKNRHLHAEKLAAFYSDRGRTSQEAKMRGDTELEELQLLDAKHSATVIASVSPPVVPRPPPLLPPPGSLPPQLYSPRFSPMSPTAGVSNSPSPFRQAMSGGAQEGQGFDFYSASREIRERAQRRRQEKEERYLRDLAVLDCPPASFSLMEAFHTLREATKVHTTSSSLSSSSSSSSVQTIAFAATSQDLVAENARLKAEIYALRHGSGSLRQRSPSFDRQSLSRGRERSPSFDRSNHPRSESSRGESPSFRGRSRERVGSVEKKHRPQDDIKLCHEFTASGSCRRGDECKFAHIRGQRSGSPHHSAGGGGGRGVSEN